MVDPQVAVDRGQLGEALAQTVRDGRVGLERHAQIEPVQEHAGDDRHLLRPGRLRLHHAGHDRPGVQRQAGPLHALRVRGGDPLLERAHGRRHGRLRAGVEAHLVRVGEQVPLEAGAGGKPGRSQRAGVVDRRLRRLRVRDPERA